MAWYLERLECCEMNDILLIVAFLLVTLLTSPLLNVMALASTSTDGAYCSQGVKYIKNSSTIKSVYGDGVYSVSRYVFLGDSTSRDSFHAFGDIFDYKCPDHSKGDMRKCTQRVKRDLHQRNKIVSTAEFYPFGRKQGWKRSLSKTYRQSMQGFVAQMTQKDVLVFNMGLHFDETATSRDYSSFYSEALATLVQDLGLTSSYSRQRRCLNMTDPYLPYVIWRDTLPQHFNSTNGHYPFHNTSDRTTCVALSQSQRSGKMPSSSALTSSSTYVDDYGNINTCDPSCLSANWQNDIAASVMQSLCVARASIWEEFSCLHMQHAKSYGDCSHMTDIGNLILVQRIVSQIFTAKNISVDVNQIPDDEYTIAYA